MNFYQLELFQTIALSQNMTQAASVLHISQPALSRTIKNLEAELGVQLFTRYGKRLALNENGEKLLRHCNSILGELDDLKNSFNDSRNKSVSLYVTAASALMPEIIEKFNTLHPYIKISMYQRQHMIGQGYDLNIYSSDFPVNEKNNQQLLEEQLCLAIPMNHKLAGLNEVDLHELREEFFISLTGDMPLYETSLHLCKNAGFIPKINLESNNPSIVMDLIRRGMGIAIIPDKTWLIQPNQKIKKIAIKSPGASRYINILQNYHNYIPGPVSLFKEFIVDYFASL